MEAKNKSFEDIKRIIKKQYKNNMKTLGFPGGLKNFFESIKKYVKKVDKIYIKQLTKHTDCAIIYIDKEKNTITR